MHPAGRAVFLPGERKSGTDDFLLIDARPNGRHLYEQEENLENVTGRLKTSRSEAKNSSFLFFYGNGQ
jgi:hypothetical protein